jgi:hypothetical protein
VAPPVFKTCPEILPDCSDKMRPENKAFLTLVIGPDPVNKSQGGHRVGTEMGVTVHHLGAETSQALQRISAACLLGCGA